jgi:hypothetical protein
MPEDTYISEAMRAIIGQPFNESTSFPISRSDIRKWAIAVYYPELPPQLYLDEEYAKTTVWGGMVAPEDFNPFAWAAASPPLAKRAENLNSDYLENHFGIDGPGLKTPLNAGAVTEYGPRMRPDDVISSSAHVLSYEEKPGRMGRMLITIVRTTWTNQAGDMVKQTNQTSIRY